MLAYSLQTYENDFPAFEVLGETACILFIHEGRTGCGTTQQVGIKTLIFGFNTVSKSLPAHTRKQSLQFL
jgi:hypothetical protein